jgi:hypothetical protein
VDYTLLYNMLSTYVWSCVYDAASVDAAVASLTVTQHVMKQAIPRDIVAKSEFPH